MKKYAVVFAYSFDDECVVVEFDNEAEAVEYLRKAYEEEYRIDKEENEWNSYGEISSDGWSAVIVNHFDDRDDSTFFRIGVICKPVPSKSRP